MEKFEVERLVYEGSDPSDTWIITGIGHTKINFENIETVPVETLNQYESGCHIHERCLGHICKTPSGMLLPIQSLAISTPTMTNDIYKAARAAFQGSSEYYRRQYNSILGDSLKKKTGRMRKGILNCHVDGSLRMVITPQWNFDMNVVTVPSYLKDKWTVVRLDSDTQKYVADYVVDGDRAIAIRPPSLSLRSVQPVIIRYWNETCLGISPELLKAFDGDYDGDEMHLYPVYSKEAIEECEQWQNTPNKAFQFARQLYQNSNIPLKGTESASFMESTTMSFEEIKEGYPQPIMAEQTRTKLEHINGFRQRYNLNSVRESFVEESIRGMGDTNTQQLSQPIVGDMSRIARIAASCVIQQEDGVVGIATETSFVPMCKLNKDTKAGNTAIRGISIICAAFQQVALDSHHAKKKSLASHDMISDMIKGSTHTLVLFDVKYAAQLKVSVKPTWSNKLDNVVYALCDPRNLVSIPKSYILGTFSPRVLRYISSEKRIEVCSRSIHAVVAYYSLPVSQIEIDFLSVLFSYKPEASEHPITSRDGITERKLRWTETTMANHYMGLTQRLRQGSIDIANVETVSASLMACNFRNAS